MQIPKSIAERITYGKLSHEPHNPPVRHIDPILKDCEDCGARVDRRLSCSLLEKPYPHWRIRCESCKKTQNPITGEFENISSIELNAEMKQHFRNRDK